MATNFADKMAACPFYKGQDAACISCEAPMHGAVVLIRFDRPEDKRLQAEIFCNRHYRRCEMYRCVMANKYPERDSENE